MYELIILGFMRRFPIHGYVIAKIFNDMFGPYAKVSSGRLYPLLAKLHQDGLIAEATDAPAHAARARGQRAYQITEAGQKRFHQLMLDTTSNPGDYGRLFWHKVPFFEFLSTDERLHLVDHYINYCQTHIFHLTSERDELGDDVTANRFRVSEEQLEATLFIMGHMSQQWQLEIENARLLREREVERGRKDE